MAQGDNYFQCDAGSKKSTEDVLRELIYVDLNGNPVVHTDENGTALEPYFTCDNKEVSLDQVLRAAFLEDANGRPYLNTTS